MSDWRIWIAEADAAEQLAQLEALAFGARSWGARSVKASFDASGVTVLLGADAAQDAPPQGFALWRSLGEEAELLTIGVAPAAQRAGLGAALLDAVVDEARACGAHRIFLEVKDGNASANTLYRKAGFFPVGVRKAYYRDGGDAAVMALDL